MFFKNRDTFAGRTARGNYILDDKKALTRIDCKAPAQRHLARLSLGPDEGDTERLCCRETDHEPADRWCRDGFDTLVTIIIGDQRPISSCIGWMAQCERALQILGAVQSAGEHKVPIEQGVCFLKMFENIGRIHRYIYRKPLKR